MNIDRILPIIFILSLILLGPTLAEEIQGPKEEGPVVVKGTITEIGQDGSFIIIVDDDTNATKFTTTPEFLEEAYLEVGDRVVISAVPSEQGLKIVDYDYLFDEEPETNDNGSDDKKEKTSSKILFEER